MPDKHLKISIVTPSYNQGKFIEDSIKSVLEQNYENFEHIIIDNCSTDNTIDILKKYPHLKWISEPDKGQSDAINKGLRIATGDIIGWLNADDYYSNGLFYKVSENLFNNNVDCIYSNLIFVNEDGAFIKNLITHKPIKWLSLFHCFIPSATFFFKRNIIDSGIFIDPEFHICMDKEFFAHIFFSNYKFAFINDFFSSFRWHDNNKSLDTYEVKKIRYNEGLKIFNRYSGIKLPQNSVSVVFYGICVNLLLIYRKTLKVFSKKA